MTDDDKLLQDEYELDLTDPFTRMFALAERWARRAKRAEAKLRDPDRDTCLGVDAAR